MQQRLGISFHFYGYTVVFEAHIGAHADDEHLFGPDFPVYIISFSMGAERRFEVKKSLPV